MPFPTTTGKNAAGDPVSLNLLPTAGQKSKAESLSVTLASDQGAASETTLDALREQIAALRAELTAVPIPLLYRQIDNVSGVTTLGTIPAGAKSALISVSGAAIRYRDDGVNPTAGLGVPVVMGDTIVYASTLSAFKCIQQTTGAVLDVAFYG